MAFLFKLFQKKEVVRCYNLDEIYSEVNNEYFEGRVDLKIIWSARGDSRAKRKIIFGSFNSKRGLIRIHRRLDKKEVPRYFLKYIVYHEMLHHLYPPERFKWRRRVHHQAFNTQEKKFKEFDLAEEFRKKYIKSIV